MIRSRTFLAVPAALAGIFLAAIPAQARPGGWEHGWERPGWGDRQPAPISRRAEADRSREGRIETAHFVAEGDAARVLGHGPVTVTSQSGTGQSGAGAEGPDAARAAFEAAVVDRLVRAGYDTAPPGGTPAAALGGQLADLRLTRTVIEPAERRRGPVSGEAAMEVGNRGTAYGLSLAIDLTRPLPPLVSTRIDLRITDRASGAALWEGRAEVATREGDAEWSADRLAARLVDALFDGFPQK